MTRQPGRVHCNPIQADNNMAVAPFLSARISAFMFIHYFSVGAWFVSLGVYMSKGLGFDAYIGPAYGMAGLGTMVATLFVGMVADRYFAAQRVLGVLHLGGGAMLLLISAIKGSPTLFLAGILVHFLFISSVVPLSMSLAFTHLPRPQQQVPLVRAAGTVGWIAAGLTIGLWSGSAMTAGPMRLAAAVQILAGLYAFTLPSTPPRAKGQPMTIAGLFGVDILKGNRDRLLWVFIACLVLVAIPKKFYDALLNNFLVEKGVILQAFDVVLESTGVQTLGQIAEALTLLALPWAIVRFGMKWVMALGMAAWVVRYTLFAFGFQGSSAITWMVIVGIVLHGLCYDFFFVSGQIWFDQRFDPAMRSRAQALYQFLLSGTGVLLGANIAGGVFQAWATAPGQHEWTPIWLTAAVITLMTLVAFLALFRERVDTAPSPAGQVQQGTAT